MNILFITLGFYPAIAWGGPVKVVYENCKELVSRGHNVTIFCTNLLNKKQKISSKTIENVIEGMRIVYFNTWNIPRWPGTLGPFWLQGFSRFLNREITQFDIVHIIGYRSLMGLTAARAARHASVPFVIQPQGTMPIRISSFLLKRMYDKVFGRTELKKVNALIALHKAESRQALSYGVPPDRIEIIHNGINTEVGFRPEYGNFRRVYSIPSDKPLILFLGRINKIKGTDMLVRAFAQLDNLGALLAIVGPDDGQLDEVKSLIQRFRLSDRVILTGLISETDKMSAYIDSDIFVLPSRSDAFPTTIMEACMMGLPMVITDRCEIAHLVKDRVAEVVPFDAQALASAIELLLTYRERYERYRANCQAMIEDTFSIKAVVDRLEEVYKRVIAEKAQG